MLLVCLFVCVCVSVCVADPKTRKPTAAAVALLLHCCITAAPNGMLGGYNIQATGLDTTCEGATGSISWARDVGAPCDLVASNRKAGVFLCFAAGCRVVGPSWSANHHLVNSYNYSGPPRRARQLLGNDDAAVRMLTCLHHGDTAPLQTRLPPPLFC